MQSNLKEKNDLFLQQVGGDYYSVYTLSKYLRQLMHFRKCLPFKSMYLAMKKGVLKAVYLTDGKEIYGLAVYQDVPAIKTSHLLYFAVFSKYRSQGLGSLFLHKLMNELESRVILEVEGPLEVCSQKEFINRTRRIIFFQRNGFYLHPETELQYFGDSLHVMADRRLSKLNWHEFYQRLYNRLYIFPVANFFLKAQ